MRAVVMRPGSFTVEERPVPVPAAGQVLVKTRACGVCGSDLHLFRHAQEMVDTAIAAGVPKELLDAGLVMGHEYVAEIVSFGEGCREELSVGDRVCSTPFLTNAGVVQNIGADPTIMGAYSEYFLLDEDRLLKVPEGVSDEAAALTEPLAIGVHAVNRSGINKGDKAIIMGCGPIGLACIAVLKERGIDVIVASDFSPRRRALAAEIGATDAVHPKETSPFESASSNTASGRTIVFDCTGVQGVFGQVVNEAPAGSVVVVAGIAHGEESFTPAVAITKELSFHFVVYYKDEEFSAALNMLADGTINWQPLVTGKVDLDGVGAIFEELEDPESHAKVLIFPHGQ